MKTIEFSKNNAARGYFYTILASVLWAICGSSSKFLFNNGVTPFQVLQMRITITAATLFLWFLIRHPDLLKISKKDIFYFIILGTIGMAGVQGTYLFAVSKIHVAAAILLEYMAPSLIALYFVIVAREKLSKITTCAIIGAMAGCYLLVGAYNLSVLNMNKAGIISGLLAAVSFACYSLMGEYGMRRYHPWTVLFFAMLFGALALNIFIPPLESFFQPYSLGTWGWILYISIFGTLVPFGLFLEGVNLIRSTRASITATLEPIVAGIISYIFLDEVMEPLQIMGGILVIASVILLQIKQEYDDQAPALIRAKIQDQNVG